MIDEYKFVNNGVIAHDTNEGLKTYEYQDNIHELLEQENVVEEIEDTIEKLYIEKKSFEGKKRFDDMLIDSKYAIITLYPFLATVILGAVTAILTRTAGFYSFVTKVMTEIVFLSLGSTIPTAIFTYKKYKKDNKLNLLSLEHQIKELEEKLKLEKEKLNELNNDKTAENYLKNATNAVIGINNKEIDTITAITRKKQLYEFYRDVITFNGLKKYNTKEFLSNYYKSDFTDEDVKFIDEMHKVNKNKVLSKKKK